MRDVARLRLAGILLDDKKYDEALKQLEAANAKEFAPLVADRRGDVLLAQGKAVEAKAAFLSAWTSMDPRVEYRRLIEAKLNLLGVDPTVPPGKAVSDATPGGSISATTQPVVAAASVADAVKPAAAAASSASSAQPAASGASR
jgi:hypothetical protein